MFAANVHELRLALLSLFTVAGVCPPNVCAAVIDAATQAASDAPKSALSDDVDDLVGVRFGAARVLNSLCAACRHCERGRTGESPARVTLAP